MQLFSILFRTAFLGLFLAVISCTKQPGDLLQPTSAELTIASARSWFEQNSLFPARARVKSSRFSDFAPAWEGAFEGKTALGVKFIEVPLKSAKMIKRLYDQSGKATTMNLSLVVFIEGGQTKETVKEILPDSDYDTSHNGTITKADFSGKVITWSWTGDLIGGSFYTNGRREGVIKPVSSTTTAGARELICTIYTSCYWSSFCYGDWGALTTYGTMTSGLNGNCSYPEYGHGSTDEYYCSSWSLVDTDSYQQCYDTGGGTGPGEGTGPVTPTQPANPCQDSQSLGQNAAFKSKMADLKSKVTQNYESGYAITGTTYQALQGQPNAAGIDLNITAPINGLIHSHYTGLLSIYSADDMYAIVGLYKANLMVDPKTFSLGVVTASGTQYLLYIDDLDKFKNFADYITNTGSFDLYSIAYQNLFNINPANDKDTNEKNFLQYLRATDCGLRLHKGNDDFSNWNPIKVDDQSNIVNNPCH